MHLSALERVPAGVGRYERTRGVPVLFAAATQMRGSHHARLTSGVREMSRVCAGKVCGVRTVDRASDRPIWRAYMYPQATRDYMRVGDAQLLMFNVRSKLCRAAMSSCGRSHLRAPSRRPASVVDSIFPSVHRTVDMEVGCKG